LQIDLWICEQDAANGAVAESLAREVGASYSRWRSSNTVKSTPPEFSGISAWGYPLSQKLGESLSFELFIIWPHAEWELRQAFSLAACEIFYISFLAENQS
jgi:hypothetical protein